METIHTDILAVVTYKSGRVEEVRSKLKKDQTPSARFNKQLKAYKAFPTVVDIQVHRY